MSPNPQSPVPNPELDALVRRVDEDRWLASRFAPPAVRARLIALYAINYEIARTSEVARERGLGDIRLQWWLDAIGELFDGGPPRAHPALIGLQSALRETPMSRARFEQMIEARRLDYESAPFPTWPAFADYVANTAGALMRLSIEACGVEISTGQVELFAQVAAWRWGLAGIARSEMVWRAQGRNLWPNDNPRDRWLETERRGRASSRRASRKTPAQIFPAVGYVALTPAYLRADHRVRVHAPLLERQVRLIAASATGRF